MEEAVNLIKELAAGRILFEKSGNRLLEIEAEPFDKQTKSAEIREIFSRYQLARDVDPLATLEVLCPLSRPFASSLSINGLEIFLEELFERYCCWIDQLVEIGQSAKDYKAAFGIRKKGIWEQFLGGWSAEDTSFDSSSLRLSPQKKPILQIGCIRSEDDLADTSESENLLTCIQIYPVARLEFDTFKCITDINREFGTLDSKDKSYFVGDLGPEVLVSGPLVAVIITDAHSFLGKVEDLGEGYWSTYWREITKGHSSQCIGGAWETKELLYSPKSIEQTTKLLSQLLRNACPDSSEIRLFAVQVFADVCRPRLYL